MTIEFRNKTRLILLPVRLLVPFLGELVVSLARQSYHPKEQVNGIFITYQTRVIDPRNSKKKRQNTNERKGQKEGSSGEGKSADNHRERSLRSNGNEQLDKKKDNSRCQSEGAGTDQASH